MEVVVCVMGDQDQAIFILTRPVGVSISCLAHLYEALTLVRAS